MSLAALSKIPWAGLNYCWPSVSGSICRFRCENTEKQVGISVSMKSPSCLSARLYALTAAGPPSPPYAPQTGQKNPSPAFPGSTDPALQLPSQPEPGIDKRPVPGRPPCTWSSAFLRCILLTAPLTGFILLSSRFHHTVRITRTIVQYKSSIFCFRHWLSPMMMYQ